MALSVGLQQILRARRRQLAWLVWFDNPAGDLYAWTGAHSTAWDGQTWLGLGYLAGMSSLRKTDNIEHVEHTFTLSGLDASLLGDLDDSVRGLGGALWLAGLDDFGRIVAADQWLTLKQNTLGLKAEPEGTVTLELVCYEALPLLGRAHKGVWSYETWLNEHSDSGFSYNSAIAQEGEAVEWRLG